MDHPGKGEKIPEKIPEKMIPEKKIPEKKIPEKIPEQDSE